jgi:hypothetical protein
VTLERLRASLADRYRIEVGSGHPPTLLGQGGMARRRVAEATARPMSLKRPVSRFGGHFNDLSRVATERHWERNARPGARESPGAASAADLGANPDG